MKKSFVLAGIILLSATLAVAAQQVPGRTPSPAASAAPGPHSSRPAPGLRPVRTTDTPQNKLRPALQAMKKFPSVQFPSDEFPDDGKSYQNGIWFQNPMLWVRKLWVDSGKHPGINKSSLDVKVKVGWVKGLNRLYFMYEAYDDYWDFSRSDLHHDIFEIVVDADQSGGPLIDEQHPIQNSARWARYFNYPGVHAPNYHIYTPAEGMDWALSWGSQPWIKELPYANTAYKYNFRPGESGKLYLEFWITPFDYAGPEGPVRAVESSLKEGKDIGLCWAIIDYDDVNARSNNGFWNLSKEHKMYGQANFLRYFTLMPLEPGLSKKIDARWSFKVLDMNRRLVAFQDESVGKVTTWSWDFGDGTTSSEASPLHQYSRDGKYIVTLKISGPDGASKLTKVWDVALR